MKIRTVLLKDCLLAGLIAFSAVVNVQSQEVMQFGNTIEIETWARTNFLSFEKYDMPKDLSGFFIIIGSHTNGVLTSEVYVYKRKKNLLTTFMVLHRVAGIIIPKEEENGISFLTKPKMKEIAYLSFDAD